MIFNLSLCHKLYGQNKPIRYLYKGITSIQVINLVTKFMYQKNLKRISIKMSSTESSNLVLNYFDLMQF